jgi:hypothetical protein
MSAIAGLLDANVAADSGLKDRILKSIKLEPEFGKLFANIARQLNPMPTLTGLDPARMEQSIGDEIGKIEAMMRAPRQSPEGRKYWGNEAIQARYRELLEARDRMKQKQRAA